MKCSQNRLLKFLCGLCVAALMIVQVLQAETIVVPTSVNRSLARAMVASRAGDTVLVENGVYHEKISVKSNVTFKARETFKAILDGQGKGIIVTMGGNAVMCGFEVRNGAIGISSTSSDNAILHCRITGMRETGISCVGHIPRIEDNVIVYNKGSGIQGWDLRSTASSISHNTIAFNQNNGIALGGNSTIVIENNIVAFNERFGLKVSDESVNVQLIKNLFFGNGSMPYIKLEDSYTFDPKFSGPRKMDFSLQSDSPCKNKGSTGDDLGARREY